MAKGTITFPVDGRLQGKIEWSSTSNGSIENSSTVTAVLYVRRTNGYDTYGSAWKGYITIDGSNYSWSDLGFTLHTGTDSAWQKAKTYSRTIKHNENGSKTITIAGSIKGPNGTSLGDYTSSGSGQAVLDTIPRQATISTAPNFTDEDNPTITYTNLAGESVDKIEAGIFKEDGSSSYVSYREISKTEGSYTFELTEEERNTLREAATGNTLTVSFVIKTTINDTAIAPFSSVTKTLTIINADPTLNPSIIDINTSTIELTGDNSKLIKFYSNAYATTGATAYKYATIAAQSITNGGSTKVTDATTFESVTDSVFVFYTKDSRGNSTSEPIDVVNEGNWIDYIKLSCNTTPSNPSADGDMVLNIKGNYWNGNFGAVANELVLQYRMTAVGTEFGDWITLTPTFDGNTYSTNVQISGLDYQTRYAFEVQASDKLITTPIKSFKVQTKTIFDWSDEDFQFNVPVNIDGDIVVGGNISGNIAGSRNIFDGTLEVGSYDSNTGNKTVLEGQYRNVYPVKIEPNTTYTFSVNGVAHKFVVLFYDQNKNFISETRDDTAGIITSPENAKYLNFRCFASDYSDDYISYKVQIEPGSTVTTHVDHINYGYKHSGIVDLIYPIGSIYMSVNSVNPSILFGGIWEQIKDTFLLSAGDIYEAGSEGGEATHKLTVAEMPSHTHPVTGGASTGGSITATQSYSSYFKTTRSIANAATATGGGQAHNNMPPYLTVYTWKRIS